MLIYWAEAYIIYAKKNTQALVVAGKETGLEVNSEKTKYMIIPRYQNAGRSHNIKIHNISFEKWNNSNIWEH